MKKQTAVEWLEDAMLGIIHVNSEEDFDTLKSMIRQAKAMEKEQIMKAFNEGTFANDEKVTAEQYYNETYNTDTP